MEAWRVIEGYNDYQISNYGRVKSNKRREAEIILKSNTDRNGYEYVMLYKNSKAKINLVHRLVAKAFIKNNGCKKEVNMITDVQQNIVKVTQEQVSKIIKSRKPLGLFYTINNDIYVGIDNRSGDAWTKDFESKSACDRWLKK